MGVIKINPRVTQREVRSRYANVIQCGYCNLQHLLSFEKKVGHTERLEGWGADVYEITGNTCIVTGYAPFGKIKPKYKVCEEYDDKAAQILYDFHTAEDVRQKLHELAVQFCNEVVSCSN